jgi:(p)ppGpp synthase/HD superfamily hydrolase
MQYTDRLETAIRFAARKHHGQMRKDSEPLPYITHLFSAAVLVSNVTDDEDVLIATLLHDTLEDTETTDDELLKLFGERVLALVKAVTLERSKDGVLMNWHEQREDGFERLKAGPKEAVYVTLADKVHNSESRIKAVKSGDSEILKRFNARKGDYIAQNEKTLAYALETIGENELTNRLRSVIDIEKGMETTN